MTDQPQVNQEQDQKQKDKELNFRALEAKYQRALEQERAAREHAEQVAREATQRKQQVNDDEDDDQEPYVDKKKLNKTLAKFGEQTKQQTQSEIQKAVGLALEEERRNNWLNQNKDFQEVMQHAEKFAQHDPELAETILRMPEGFDRQKLVYSNIKALGLHKPKAPESTIQQKVDANQKGPYYRPTGQGAAPYAGQQSDFSPTGQKAAYEKMKELKSRLRLG